MALTLRLDENELEKLEEIREFLDIKTASGTLKDLIKRFMPLQRDRDNTTLELHELEAKHNRLCRSIRDMEAAKLEIETITREHNIARIASGSWGED